MKHSILLFIILIFSQNLAAQSSLFGMTEAGGAGQGTIFKTDQNGNNHMIVYNQFLPTGSLPGTIPVGSLIKAKNGKLYGMTGHSGKHGTGVIFEYDLVVNKYTKKIDINTPDGAYPKGSLMEATNNKLYGMTWAGGANNRGVIFEYDYSANIYTKKIDLSNELGTYPTGSLIQGKNGKLYGMTSGGSGGVIFEYDFITNLYTKKIQLSSIGASSPNGSLLQANNGKLYGMTSTGGKIGLGVLFEYDYNTNIIKKLFDMDNINGAKPEGSLIQANNGKIYGMTRDGGISDDGVIFEYNLDKNQYIKLIDLNDEIGTNPTGTLMQASNGKLYGMTSQGGQGSIIIGGGVLFEYEIEKNTFIKKISFTGNNGQIPTSGSLIEVKIPVQSKDLNYYNYSIKLLPNPATNSVLVEAKSSFNSFQILDINQKIIQDKVWRKNEMNKINVENLPAGIYFVKFYNFNNQLMGYEKLVIQK